MTTLSDEDILRGCYDSIQEIERFADGWRLVGEDGDHYPAADWLAVNEAIERFGYQRDLLVTYREELKLKREGGG